MSTDAILVLNDGTEFEGEAIGALREDATSVASGKRLQRLVIRRAAA